MAPSTDQESNRHPGFKSPEVPYSSPDALQRWWDQSGRKVNAKSIIGDGPVSAKGSAAFLLKHLVDTGVLDPRRFATPDTFLIAPDAVSRVKPGQLNTLQDRAIVLDTFSRSRVIGTSLLQARGALNVAPSIPVIVRSLGLAEGSAGKSAAGIFESVKTSAALSDLRDAAQRVVASAFAAPALTLNREYGLRDTFPGLLIQPVLEGIHCVFHTSRPGQVCTVIKNYNDRWPVYEKLGTLDTKRFSYRPPPTELRTFAHEAAAVLSQNGKVPIECEMMYLPNRQVAVMLQLRFVTSLQHQDFSPHGSPLAETQSVVGANTLKENWVMDITRGNFDTLAALWLIQKRLKLDGIHSFAVLMNSSALSSLSGKDRWSPDATFAPLRLGSAFVEHDGGQLHENSSESHTLRLAYDKGAISMYMNFDVASLRARIAEEIHPDKSLWNEGDALFLNRDVVAKIGNLGRDCGVRCYRTKASIVLAADENTSYGAIYQS